MNAEIVAFWRTLPPNACLSTEELAKGFGVCGQAIRCRVKAGTLPPPKHLGGKMHADSRGWNSISSRGRRMTMQSRWHVGDVLRCIDSQGTPPTV